MDQNLCYVKNFKFTKQIKTPEKLFQDLVPILLKDREMSRKGRHCDVIYEWILPKCQLYFRSGERDDLEEPEAERNQQDQGD